jgi:hypothetical protein
MVPLWHIKVHRFFFFFFFFFSFFFFFFFFFSSMFFFYGVRTFRAKAPLVFLQPALFLGANFQSKDGKIALKQAASRSERIFTTVIVIE